MLLYKVVPSQPIKPRILSKIEKDSRKIYLLQVINERVYNTFDTDPLLDLISAITETAIIEKPFIDISS